MILIPIIERELRTESRSQSHYSLRIFGVFFTTIVFWILMSDQRQSAASLGSRLFVGIHITLLGVIWIFGPAVVADCLSREKREGTLGLLFLTSLTARDIVLGKSLLPIVRTFVLWLAVLPILTLPFLLGGVGWLDVISAFTLQACSVLLVLAAGLAASSASRRSSRSFILASLFSCCLLIVSGLVLGLLVYSQSARFNPPLFPSNSTFGDLLWMLLMVAMVLSTGIDPNSPGIGNSWSQLFAIVPTGFLSVWLRVLGMMMIFSLLVFLLSIKVTARRLQASWRDTPLTVRQLRRRQIWFTPRFWRPLFHRTMKRKLDRNPIIWLQQYSATARLSKWGWCLVVLIADFPFDLASNFRSDLVQDQMKLFILLLLGMAFSAAGTFRNERETGALELLLVTPLTVRQIIVGRAMGLWSQFLPAAGLGLFVWSSVAAFDAAAPSFVSYTAFRATLWAWMTEVIHPVQWFLVWSFLTLPLVGFFFSLRLRSVLATWLAVSFFAILWPLIMPMTVFSVCELTLFEYAPRLKEVVPSFLTREDSVFWCWFTQLSVVGLSAYCLNRDLTRRNFVQV